MRRIVATVCVVVASAAGVVAQGGPEKSQVELDAALAKGDRATYERMLIDDFTWVGQDGRSRDKRAIIDELQPLTTEGSTEVIDVRSYPGGAVMTGTRRYPKATDVRFLRVWVQRGNRWQLAAHQGVPIGKPAAAATASSSPMPPNSGPAGEIKAIAQAMAALQTGNSKGDVKNFGESVTEGFVAINASGNLASRQDRMAQLAKRPDAAPPTEEDASTRVYGDLAVTTQVVRFANGRSRQMIIHVKQDGTWRRAAIVSTPIASGQ